MNMVIIGTLSLENEGVTITVEGEYQQYGGCSPADAYTKAKETIIRDNKEKLEKEGQ